MNSSDYTSKRYSIAVAVADLLKTLDGTGPYRTNLYNNVHPRLLFWDEVSEYPAVHLNLGSESRVYQGGGYKDRFLSITVRCYVESEDDSQRLLEMLLEDIETVIEKNGRLAYQDSLGATNHTQDITIESIETDEGALAPLGVGEILLQVRY